MRAQKTVNHYWEALLHRVGKILIGVSIFGFWLSLSLAHYSITYINDEQIQETLNFASLGSSEYYRKAYPGAAITIKERPFPIVPTVILLFGLSLATRTRRESSPYKKLWTVLKVERKIELPELLRHTGQSKAFILNTLPDINLERGTSFYYHPDTDTVVDHDSAVKWHLAKKCSNCGANVDTQMYILIGRETPTCPYCDNKIDDPDLEKHLATL